MTRWRITVRGATLEVRGWLDDPESDGLAPDGKLAGFSAALKPLGLMVYASPADAHWNPFDQAEQ